ncbi:MAG: zf-HC2 domain-containing protein [Oscillospiraceae bacterium]|nr:zf-HC2 domain-containing protein [Oscillospiraceae bacterium]
MKDCATYQALISRLIDREITPEEGEELAAHARECEECRAVYTAFVSLSHMLSSELVDPPEELAENVMAEIRRSELWKQNRKPRRQLRRWAAIAASAVLVIGLGALTLPRLLGGMGAAKSASPQAAYSAAAPAAAPASGANAAGEAARYDSAAADDSPAEAEMAPPIPVSDSFAAPASETTKSEEQMISEAIARSEEPETVAPTVDVTGQGRGRSIAALLSGTPGDLPANQTPNQRFLLRYDVDGISTQVLISVYGEKVFYISLSGEESDMMLADCSWSTLRARIYN